MNDPIARIATLVGAGRATAGDAVDAKYLRDWMVPMADGRPAGLVEAERLSDVVETLRVCHASTTPVVPQGGRTGLAGGATPVNGSIVLALERFTGVEEIDAAASTITVKAGTPLEVVQDAASGEGLFFPLDLGARGSCQIGGNIATNAGGNRVIRYGMTRDLVLGLEVVLADGTVVHGLNKLVKNNAGLDTKHVFIGSEGTLGVLTRAVLKLFPRPRSQAVAFCAIDGYARVPALLAYVRAALGGSLSAFEVMWPDFYTLVTGPGGAEGPLPPGAGGYVLIEALGTQEDADRRRFEDLLGAALESGLVTDGVLAQSAAEVQACWRVRDASGEFPRLLWPNVAFDIGIPIQTIGEFVTACVDALRRRWPDVKTACFGHVADSNIHLNVKAADGEQPETEIDDLVYGLVRDWRGTVSSEHGIGLLKRPYLSYTRSPEELALMRTLKVALDPRGILNPGKVFLGQ